MVATARRARIKQADRARIQSHLRAMLRCHDLWVDEAGLRGGTCELRVAGNVVGTVDQVEEEGELSWPVTLIVLEDDLVEASSA